MKFMRRLACRYYEQIFFLQNEIYIYIICPNK